MSEQAGLRDPRRARTAFMVLLGLVAIAIVVFIIMLAFAPTENASGQCSGIGWGCSLAPRDALLFAGAFLGIPTFLGTLIIGALVIAAFVRWTPLIGWIIGILAAVLAAAFSLVTAVLIVFVF